MLCKESIPLTAKPLGFQRFNGRTCIYGGALDAARRPNQAGVDEQVARPEELFFPSASRIRVGKIQPHHLLVCTNWQSLIHASILSYGSWGRKVGLCRVKISSRVESPLQRYPPSFGGKGRLHRPQHVAPVVVDTGAFALVQTLHTFLGQDEVGTTGANVPPLSWAARGGRSRRSISNMVNPKICVPSDPTLD